MNKPALMRNHFNVSSQSYIFNIIEGVKSLSIAKADVSTPVETTSFDNVCPNLVTRLSHKMDTMDKPERLRAYRA